jgi:hypothetical protein
MQKPGMKKGYMPLLESRVRLLENELLIANSHRPNESEILIDSGLIKHFFTYVNCYLGVFHEQSFMATLNAQPLSLLNIMYALGLLYYQADTGSSYDFTWLDRYSKTSLSNMKLDQTCSLDTCSTWLLIAYYAFCIWFF